MGQLVFKMHLSNWSQNLGELCAHCPHFLKDVLMLQGEQQCNHASLPNKKHENICKYFNGGFFLSPCVYIYNDR
jgi:hypothetical protein